MRLPKTILALLLSVAALGSSVLPGRKTTGEIPPPGISFSHGSGVYAQKELTVTLRAPRGCTVAFTTDGTFPTKEDDSGLSAVEHGVSHAYGLHGQKIEEAGVKAFVPPAHQDQVFLPGQFACEALGERPARRSQGDDAPLFAIGAEGAQCLHQRIEHEHHARPAAIGAVIHAAVPVRAFVARIGKAELHDACLPGPSHQA